MGRELNNEWGTVCYLVRGLGSIYRSEKGSLGLVGWPASANHLYLSVCRPMGGSGRRWKPRRKKDICYPCSTGPVSTSILVARECRSNSGTCRLAETFLDMSWVFLNADRPVQPSAEADRSFSELGFGVWGLTYGSSFGTLGW